MQDYIKLFDADYCESLIYKLNRLNLWIDGRETTSGVLKSLKKSFELDGKARFTNGLKQEITKVLEENEEVERRVFIRYVNGILINKYEITEAIIKPKYQLTYEDANEILEIEPKEEIELIEIKKLLEKSINFRKKQGAIIFESPNSKIKLDKDKVILNKLEKTISQVIVAESMILMGYVTSLFIDKYDLAAAFRIQKINCNPSEILNRYNDSDIKYIILINPHQNKKLLGLWSRAIYVGF